MKTKINVTKTTSLGEMTIICKKYTQKIHRNMTKKIYKLKITINNANKIYVLNKIFNIIKIGNKKMIE
jgi:hypothetical protein